MSTLFFLALAAVASPPCAAVSREEMLAVMRESRGYDLTATANGARLQAETILGLVRAAARRAPEGPPLCLGHEEWFFAYLERVGLSRERAPTFTRLAYDIGQDAVVDYHPDRALGEVRTAAPPERAALVEISWPEAPGRPDHYSFEDTRAQPHLRVTNRRLIRYRLLDFGDRVIFAEIEGLRGRPTSGALGMLFDLLGEAAIVESRMAITSDGLQVSWAEGKKAFMSVAATVTVYPDGRVERGLRPERPDLQALEERLKRPWREKK
jgi:hypothetical protein